jgi:uncharacterized membrane protein YkoI
MFRCLSSGVIVLFGFTARPQTPDFAKLPAAAQKTVREQAGDGTIGEVEKNEEDGETRYTVTITMGDTDRDVTVAGDGALRSVEISLDDTSEMVRGTIKRIVGGGKLETVARSFGDGKINYVVTMTNTNGAARTFTVEVNGKVSSLQVGLEETPAAVRATIEAQAAKLHATVDEIDRTSDEEGISYDVDVTAEGKDRDFSVMENGRLESIEVFEADLPAPGRRTLSERVGDGKLVRIDKEFEDGGGIMFHVQSRKDGKPFNFLIGPGGRFRGMEEDDN